MKKLRTILWGLIVVVGMYTIYFVVDTVHEIYVAFREIEGDSLV
jgi:hypothetical protein